MIFDIDIQKMLLTFQFLFLLICVTPKEYITQKGCAVPRLFILTNHFLQYI